MGLGDLVDLNDLSDLATQLAAGNLGSQVVDRSIRELSYGRLEVRQTNRFG